MSGAPYSFLSAALWRKPWVDGARSLLPLFHYTMLLLFFFLGEKKKKGRYEFLFQIKNLKHAVGKGGGGPQKNTSKTEPVHNNFPPRGYGFPSFLPPPFRSCPCLRVLWAKSHIPSLPLPAQTPFGGPTFPTAALGITCNTHICKTNQVWKGQGVPAQLRKAAAATEQIPFLGPPGWGWAGDRLSPSPSCLSHPDCEATEALATENATGHSGLRHVRGGLWEAFVLSQSSAEGQ